MSNIRSRITPLCINDIVKFLTDTGINPKFEKTVDDISIVLVNKLEPLLKLSLNDENTRLLIIGTIINEYQKGINSAYDLHLKPPIIIIEYKIALLNHDTDLLRAIFGSYRVINDILEKVGIDISPIRIEKNRNEPVRNSEGDIIDWGVGFFFDFNV